MGLNRTIDSRSCFRMQSAIERVYTANPNFVTPLYIAARDINLDPRWVWIKWSGNHFAECHWIRRNLWENRSFCAALRGLNGSPGVSRARGVKIITGHFILIRAPPPMRPIHVNSRKRDPARNNESRPRAPSTVETRRPTRELTRASSFYYCEKLFQGSSYFPCDTGAR